jgi:SsrA-binding protein
MASNTPTDSANRTLAENRRARAKFTIDDTFEVGIVLVGSEVKSIRAGKIELADAWAHVTSDGTLQLLNSYVAPYAYAKAFGHEPKRVRPLLAHREEIDKIEKKVKAKGYTIIPLRVYLKNGRVKVEIGLAKGKDLADRREELKEREAEREARAAMSNRRAKS